MNDINLKSPVVEENDLKKIFEAKNYRNLAGMTVTVLTNIDDPTDTMTMGHTVVLVGGEHQVPIQFIFPSGMEVKECFLQFEDLARKTFEEQMKKMREEAREKNLIIPASSAPAPRDNNRGFSLV